MSDNVKEALMYHLSISDKWSWCVIRQVGDDEIRALQLIITVDSIETWKTLVLTFGIGYTLGVMTLLAERECYESAGRIWKAIDQLDEELELDLPRSLDDERLKKIELLIM